MSDLIDRQAAIDAIKAASKEIQHWLWEAEGCESYCEMVADVETCLDDLPSVQPDQEKPAKWIIYEVANCDGEPPIAWECPECGEVVSCKYKFCPECGKPMEV